MVASLGESPQMVCDSPGRRRWARSTGSTPGPRSPPIAEAAEAFRAGTGNPDFVGRFVGGVCEDPPMVDEMGHTDLRRLVRPVVAGLKDRYRHEELPEVCRRLGLPPPPAREERFKADRLKSSFDALSDVDLALVADRLLQQEKLSRLERRAIEDALWAEQGSVE